MPSVRKNFIYSSILMSINYIVPLIVFPYISRVLGVEKIGICSFVDSVIQYFILFSTMGITNLGIREIAKAGNDSQKRSNVFSSLVVLNAITTVIAIIVLFICINTIEKFSDCKSLLYIGMMKLFFNLFLVEWLYKGIEDFQYITIRTVIVRVLYVFSILIFVRSESDYILFFFLTNLVIIVNAIINIVHARKDVKFVIKGINVRPFISSFLVLGVYQIVTSFYTTFNVAYLGFVSTSAEVGYYSTAHKFFNIIIALFTAFTGVMLPRMSSLLSEGNVESFKSYVLKSQHLLFELSIPLIIFVAIFAADLIRLMAGEGYEGAIIPMQIAMPLVFVIGYEQVLIIQILMPMNKDKLVFINSCIGAVVGLLLNFILVSKFFSIGATIAWFGAEIAVLLCAQFWVNKFINIGFPLRTFLKILSFYTPLILILLFMTKYMAFGFVLRLVISVSVVFCYFMIVNLLVIKNSLVGDIIQRAEKNLMKTFNKLND